MLKKCLIASAIFLTASHVALANPAPYLGAGIGMQLNTANSSNSNDYFRGVPLNVFAGYGGLITENFYLAGELGATLATANITEHGDTLKSTYRYGASVLPGIALSDNTLAFLRLGVVRTRFTEIGNTLTGGQLGFGLQTVVTQNVDLRADYEFVAYRRASVSSDHNSWFHDSPKEDSYNVSLIYRLD